MAQFSVNAQRFDPYKNFKFRVLWDSRPVAGISKVSSLKRSTEVVKHRDGADPSSSRKMPVTPSTKPSISTAASPTTSSLSSGPTRFGTTARASARLRSRTSARISASNSTMKRASWQKHTTCSAAGFPSMWHCPISTPMPMPLPSSTSNSRTKAGNATTPSWNHLNRRSLNRKDRRTTC